MNSPASRAATATPGVAVASSPMRTTRVCSRFANRLDGPLGPDTSTTDVWSIPPVNSAAIVKEWFDLVLGHAWAYGSTGNALKGKITFQALTAGGGQENYDPNGLNRFTIRELTTPFQATANLCGMDCLPPFAVLGIHQGIPENDRVRHAEDYRRTLIALRDNRIDLDRARASELLNQDLNGIINEV